VNVARIAERFGGGGHRNAAGCTVTGDLCEAERVLTGMLLEAVEMSLHESNSPRLNAPRPLLETMNAE
jgi:phosphoesterase RecJ-like protein